VPTSNIAVWFGRASTRDRPADAARRYRPPPKPTRRATTAAKLVQSALRYAAKLRGCLHRYSHSIRDLDPRFRSCYLGVVMLCLVLGVAVATRETPETMSLSDDVSNDAVAVGFESPLSPTVSRLVSRPEGLPPAAPRSSGSAKVKKRSIPPLVVPTHIGRGLLQFVSVLRT